MVNIADKIKELRTARGMTQADFAARLGVSKSAVSSYENGSRLPSYDVLIKIAHIFKVSVDHLLGNDSKDVVDVTGLTRKQVNLILDIAATYRRCNHLLRHEIAESGIHKVSASVELSEEELGELLSSASPSGKISEAE